jgi:Sulfotransferase domain
MKLFLLLLLLAFESNGARGRLHTPDVDVRVNGVLQRLHSGDSENEQRCFAGYARRLRATNDSRLAAIAFDRVPPALNVSASLDQLRSKPIVIGAGQGTTATHGFVRLFAESKGYNMTAVHWATCCANNGRCCASLAVAKGETFCAPSCLGRSAEIGIITGKFLRGFKPLRPSQVGVGPGDWIEATRATLEDVRLIEALASFDVLCDAPVAQYVYYLYKLFPRALIVYTDRAPLAWASRRVGGHPATPVSALFAHRHRDYAVSEFSQVLNAAMFVAMRHFVECLVPAERLLVVDFFEQTPRDAAAAIKAFVGREWPQVAAAPAHTDEELVCVSGEPSPRPRGEQRCQSAF